MNGYGLSDAQEYDRDLCPSPRALDYARDCCRGDCQKDCGRGPLTGYALFLA